MPRRRRGTYLKAKEVAEGARREMRKVIGPASQQRRRATLRKALNDAIRKKHIAGPNPASMVELESGESPPPELWTAETERHWRETGAVPGSTMVWRPEQCGAFLDAASGERLYNLYLMASQTGMRRGELCGLRWQDVDIDTGRMEIKKQLSAGGEEGPTKTKAGRRTVPLDTGLLAMLRTHRTEQKKDRMRWGEL
jgi:integrase